MRWTERGYKAQAWLFAIAFAAIIILVSIIE